MPPERESVTIHTRFPDSGFSIYLTIGRYRDGRPGEVFIKNAGKEGSTLQGVIDAWATMFSMGLQAGFTLDELSRKFAGVRFEPRGKTDDPLVPFAESLVDYVVRAVAVRFGDEKLRDEMFRPSA